MNPSEYVKTVSKRSFGKMSDVGLTEIGNEHYYDGNYEIALTFFSCAISRSGNIPIYLRKRGQAAYKLDRFADTAADCFRALKMDPEFLVAHYLLGLALCRMKKIDKGLSYIQRAIHLGKKQGTNYTERMNYALGLWRQRRQENARLVEKNDRRQVKKIKISIGVPITEIGTGVVRRQ